MEETLYIVNHVCSPVKFKFSEALNGFISLENNIFIDILSARRFKLTDNIDIFANNVTIYNSKLSGSVIISNSNNNGKLVLNKCGLIDSHIRMNNELSTNNSTYIINLHNLFLDNFVLQIIRFSATSFMIGGDFPMILTRETTDNFAFDAEYEGTTISVMKLTDRRNRVYFFQMGVYFEKNDLFDAVNKNLAIRKYAACQ